MLNWLSKNDGRKRLKLSSPVSAGLQTMYKDKLLPLEKEHLFHQFYSPELTDADFSCRPMVLLLGQYSTGKTTFVRHLLGRDYPGLRIGPEPTTDKFVAVCHGDSDQVVPGHATVVDKSLPFTQLGHFGSQFLSRFECAKCSSPVLEGITLIDSPGVLAGEKQRLNRGYIFEDVVSWFAERVDMILVLFDVSKLDISDEFRRVIISLKGSAQKVHIVLNKADRVTTPQLMRVYGALMWSLGKVMDTPETCRVYIGSFWEQPLDNDEQRKLFESEENDLYTMLTQLPRRAALRKLNDVIKRARLAKVHAFILDHLVRQMPTLFGKSREQARLTQNLESIFKEISKDKDLPLGDFPELEVMKEKLRSHTFSDFRKLDKKKLEVLEEMMLKDVPNLLGQVPNELEHVGLAEVQQVGTNPSPFAVMKVGGATESSAYKNQWLHRPNTEEYRKDFEALDTRKVGKVAAPEAKEKMVQSRLPSDVLHKIWTLADVDKDNSLTLYEYSLAMHFIKMKLEGLDLPNTLPREMEASFTSSPAQ